MGLLTDPAGIPQRVDNRLVKVGRAGSYARDSRRAGCAPPRGRLALTSAAANVTSHE